MHHPTITRKGFLRRLCAGAPTLLFFPHLNTTAFRQDKEPLGRKLVHEFVLQAHRDLDKVKALLEETPALLHAAWDWGGGDFEVALGAASHVGHRELAEYLLGQGARMNLFTAAMLGNLNLVKAITGPYPKQLFTKGPHGLSLMHHARKGGEQALAVVDWLEAQGVKE